jgi:hypothetical protein
MPDNWIIIPEIKVEGAAMRVSKHEGAIEQVTEVYRTGIAV